MDETLRTEILKRLRADFKFKNMGAQRWSGGACPKCPDSRGKELYVYIDNPWTLVCGRESKCGARIPIKEQYPDLFDNWSARHQQTAEDPHAAARAYLRDGRRLNLSKLGGIYAQESYQDWQSKETSATVRFAVPYGKDMNTGEPRTGFWERLIDRPQRFGKKKANMPKGWSFKGWAWHHPEHAIDMLAAQKELWVAEGIFDALSLNEAFDKVRPDARAVSSLSTNNYPEKFLDQIAEAAKRLGLPLPKIIWAFDVGGAGVKYCREYVELAKKAGWPTGAAQVTPDGEGAKEDWNDLLSANKLTAEKLDEYLGNGEITIAPGPSEKAYLLWQRHGLSEFSLVFNNQTYWAKLSAAEINQLLTEWHEGGINADMDDETRANEAARACLKIADIANCTFRALYFERPEDSLTGTYYFRIAFPGKTPETRANLSASAVSKAQGFKETLLSVAAGAMFTGSNHQLEKMMKRQLNNIRTVIAIDFRGYSALHKAWIFDKVAICGARVLDVNEEDYFEIGHVGVKLPKSTDAESNTDRFNIQPSLPENKNPWFWWQDLYTSFGPLGTIALAYWFLSLFAEQVRHEWQDLTFLEMDGEPGSGKTTLLVFLWKLVGRMGNYEGFDPAKVTAAAMGRILVQVSNLPVVMIEGDRKADQPTAKKFDWDELKSLYNGTSPRARGVATADNKVYSPRFRGSVVVAQNWPITLANADRAVLERIVNLHVDKSRFSEAGLQAGERLKALDVADVSHWIAAMVRQEKAVMTAYNDLFPKHFSRLRATPHVSVDRLARTHAQVAAAVDCLSAAMKYKNEPVITSAQRQEAHELLTQMCVDRHGALDADHYLVAQFWENFDYLDGRAMEAKAAPALGEKLFGLNYSRSPNSTIVIHFAAFEQQSAQYRISLPTSIAELKKLLIHSKSRKFVKQGSVNCIDGKTRHCWLFQRPAHEIAELERIDV